MKTNVNRHVNVTDNSEDKPSWSEALKDAERKIAEHAYEVRCWKLVAHICRKKVKSGEPWPGSDESRLGREC